MPRAGGVVFHARPSECIHHRGGGIAVDPITLVSILFGIVAVLLGAVLEGTSLLSLISPSAFMIIAGGTTGATLACFSIEEILKLPKSTMMAFQKSKVSVEEIIDVFVELATAARREGLLVLENTPIKVDNPILKRGIRLIVDATDPALVKDMLATEAAITEEEAKTQAGIYQAAGGFSPTMGIIGTVMGLIAVLSHLADTDKLGHSIAMAFIATLYGIAFANLVFLPMAKKMTFVAKRQTKFSEIIIEGILSIQSGDNPRIIHEKLLSFVDGPSAERLRAKQAAGKSGGK